MQRLSSLTLFLYFSFRLGSFKSLLLCNLGAELGIFSFNNFILSLHVTGSSSPSLRELDRFYSLQLHSYWASPCSYSHWMLLGQVLSNYLVIRRVTFGPIILPVCFAFLVQMLPDISPIRLFDYFDIQVFQDNYNVLRFTKSLGVVQFRAKVSFFSSVLSALSAYTLIIDMLEVFLSV